jgi:preprotein translocase subunit SecB
MTEDAQAPIPQQNASLPLTVHAQFIKDLSFENPNAPDTLKPGANDGAPQMQVNVNMDSKPMADKGFFEVVLSVEATATRGETTLFIAEVQYGVVCSVAENVPDQHIHPLVMIEAPKLAFPFVRQILCDAVMAGGYPPLMLNPVDFEGLYIAQYKREQEAEGAQEAG